MSRKRAEFIARSFRRLAAIGNHDFCPWANRYVYWLKQPIGWLVVAAAAAALTALFLEPQAWIIVGSLVAVMLADPAGGTPQVSLGEVFVTSAHQANGALLLMTATVAALLMRRRLEHTEAPAAESSD